MITRRKSRESRFTEETYINGRMESGKEEVSISDTDETMSMIGEHKRERNYEKPDLTGDKASIALLVFLYVLQGVPLGLAGSIPMLLQAKKVSYKQQAMFSFVYWPYSVKLLWAPIVDAAFLPWFGRRKTWLVPMQYMIGIFMIIISRVSYW